MNYAEFIALLPFVIITVTAVVTMLTISVYRDHRLTAAFCIAGLSLAIFSLPAVSSFLPQQVTALLVLDRYALFFMGLLFSATLVITFFAYGYLEKRALVKEEFYLLLLLAVLGAAVLVARSHFVSFFLGLETLSVSLYALLGYRRSDERGTEAAVKYLVLAAVSSAFLLFGMASSSVRLTFTTPCAPAKKPCFSMRLKPRQNKTQNCGSLCVSASKAAR